LQLPRLFFLQFLQPQLLFFFEFLHPPHLLQCLHFLEGELHCLGFAVVAGLNQIGKVVSLL
jgi:hypothetical protein